MSALFTKKQIRKQIKNKGFTLVELILVFSLTTLAGLYALKEMQRLNEEKTAMAEGERIRELGIGLTEFITHCYGGLSNIPAGATQVVNAADPLCNFSVTATNIAGAPTPSVRFVIPYSTLKTAGYYPSLNATLMTSFDNNNSTAATGYDFEIIRIGSGSGSQFKASVSTKNAWVSPGATTAQRQIKGDLIGLAIKRAGNNAGAVTNNAGTFATTTPGRATGSLGNWVELNTSTIPYATMFNNSSNGSTAVGKLVYRAMVNSTFDSIYLRRDGTNPMLGDLCMAYKQNPTLDRAATDSVLCASNPTSQTYASISSSYGAATPYPGNGTAGPSSISGANWIRSNGAVFYTTDAALGFDATGNNRKVIVGAPEGVGASQNGQSRITMAANNSVAYLYGNKVGAVSSILDFENVIARGSLITPIINSTTAVNGPGGNKTGNPITPFGNYAGATNSMLDFAGDTIRNQRAMQYNGTVAATNTDGLIRARDVLLEDLRGGTAGWLSDRLPRYSSRGVLAVTCTNGSCGNVNKPKCPTNATPKVEVSTQVAWIQGKVLGTLNLTGTGSYASPYGGAIMTGISLTLSQDQYTLGSFVSYAVDNGTTWGVFLQTPDYQGGGTYSGGIALVHAYCDFGA